MSGALVGALPPSWEVRRLRTLGTFSKGSGGSKEDNREAGVPVVRYGDLYTTFDTVITEPVAYVEDDVAGSYTPLPCGALVMTASGEDPEEIGKAALSRLEAPAVVGGDAILMTPSQGVDGLFLAYVLQSAPLRAQKAMRSTGFTVVHITAGRLKTLTLPLPPLPEQEAIADFLDRETAKIDALIEKQNQLVERLRERRADMMLRAVTRGLTGAPVATTRVPWIGQVAAHWRVVPLRRYARMRTGHTPSKSEPSYWEDCTIPWFTLADVWQLRQRNKYLGETENQISELGLANSAAELLPAGTVVLSRTASVGFSGIMPTAMATSQDFWNWIPGKHLDSEFLYYVLQSMSQAFAALKYGSTHQTIYYGDAAGLRIPLPPLEEQRAIAVHLDREAAKIDALIAKAERFVELARERRSALITAAVTGELDITERNAS